MHMTLMTAVSTKFSLEEFSAFHLPRLENFLESYLHAVSFSCLREALSESVLDAGKRLRPLFIYAVGEMVGASPPDPDVPAAAVELIHCYSLIHDDLPAMDNADLRRGKPSCHKKHGEAMAILAGDALQALAFEVLSHHPAAVPFPNKPQIISIF